MNASPTAPLSPDEFDSLDAILDDLRTRMDETPQWEFCDGFMAALLCCRRLISPAEYLPVLLDINPPAEGDGLVADEEAAGQGAFANPVQAQAFMQLWMRRWNEVASGLAAKVERLDDESAFHPEVMDLRGAVASLPDAERADMAHEVLPSFAQVWALGFMFAVESWPEEWAAPRDKTTARALDEALQAIVALTEDDEDEATLSVFSDDAPPSVSLSRLDAFADAVWAVYDLHRIWRSIGPRVETVHKAATPGRNDPCPCGSGKKFKKCHGA